MWKRRESRGAGGASLEFLLWAQPLGLEKGEGAGLAQAGLRDPSALR